LSDSEKENLTGIWGGILLNRDETSDDDERPEKRLKMNKNASAVVAQVLCAGSGQGNPVLTSLFQLSRYKVWMRNDHILNFVSCDGVLTTPLGKELLDNSIIKLSNLKDPQAEIGYVTSNVNGKYLVYNLFIKIHLTQKFL
jgi:hypothetical protein